MARTCKPIKSYFFVCYSLVDFLSARLSHLGALGVHPSGGSLKTHAYTCTRCCVQTLLSLGRSWDLRVCFRLYITMSRMGFMVRVVFQLFLFISKWGFFFPLIQLMCRSHLTSFWISFRENCSIYSSRFGVSMGR